jgi:enoyl-CoA hydratase/carnithine racemase
MLTSRQFAEGRVLADVEEGVGLITFNQPKKHNAMSVEMWQGLSDILDIFAAEDAVRAVVLTGAGHKAFVSGADISQFDEQRADAAAQVEYDRITRAGRARLAAFPKPVIARIRGYCLGGGLAIALQADLRIAAHDSEFAIPAARLGIAYGFDMVQALVALVGPGHARRLLYTGQRIDAEEAERIGLVNKVVADERLSEEVLELARVMADNAPLSLRAMKLAVREAGRSEQARDMAAVEQAIAACFDSADYREGRAAFREKRPPRFVGR